MLSEIDHLERYCRFFANCGYLYLRRRVNRIEFIFGPVEVGGAVADYGHAKFFFQIARIF
jgi:hypothetical protein